MRKQPILGPHRAYSLEAGGVKTEMAQLYGLIRVHAWHGYVDYTEMD